MADKRQLSDSEEESNEQTKNENGNGASNYEERDVNTESAHGESERDQSRPGEKKKIKRKKLEFEHIYLSQLPTSECYEKSYMHKENITHVLSATKTDFIITGE